MASRRRSKRKSSSREIPADILHEILAKLPTKDVARSNCVSRLWRSVASDPSFRRRHAMATHVTSANSEALLVTERREPGHCDAASVFHVSSRKAMCCVSIPSGYGLANVCNGFLCFVHGNGPRAHGNGPKAQAVLCNPVTGETVALPKAPPLAGSKKHLFALGFSSSTKEYKLFRLWSSSSKQRVKVCVYTLGDPRGWRRRHSFTSPCSLAEVSPPVSIDDKIYMVAVSWTRHENPKRLLVIDVATESCCTYNLPDYEPWPYGQPTASAFELNGRLCFVAHINGSTDSTDFMDVHFWVMSPPPEDNDLEGDHKQLSWDLRYTFRMKEEFFWFSTPWGCWLDDDEMMCYLMNETLHKYDTRKHPSISCRGFLQWDKKLHLPAAPSRSKCLWNVCGVFRPTLLSPLSVPLAPSQDDDGNKHQFEHDMLIKLGS